MALPTLTKTWNFDVNIASPGPNSVANWQTWHWTLKELFKANGWSVAGSGGAGAGGGGGMDAVDRWVVSTDITAFASSVNNNWIVLQNDNVRTGFQVLYQPRSHAGGAAGGGLLINLSPTGVYTGGAQTTLPTATDQIAMVNSSVWASTVPPVTHWWNSTDYQLTRVAWSASGVSQGFLLFDQAVSSVSGWTDPWVAIVAYPGSLTTYANLHTGTGFTRAKAGSTTMAVYLTSEGWNSDAAGERMTFGNDLDGGAFPIPPIGVASETTGARGRHGELVDIWWGSTIISDGAHYPDTLPRQFVQVGHLILPWDQTAGQMSRVI